MKTDVLVVGGGTGGVAAAIAAAERGASVLLLEPSDWIGGQLTAQAVPPDEHPWIESFGRTRRYALYREAVRAAYRKRRGLSESARRDPRLNPGGGWVSALCHEPLVGRKVLERWLDRTPNLTVRYGATVIASHVSDDLVRRVWVRTRRGEFEVEPKIVVDATEEGDLLPLVGAEYVLGAEARAETGEPGAPETADPDDVQGITWCAVLGYEEGADHTGDAPPDYDRWRAFRPEFWPGPLLGFDDVNPVTLAPRRLPLFGPFPSLFPYRQIADPAIETGAIPTTVVNWPMNDYFLGRVVDVAPSVREARLEDARRLTLALLHWLRTEAPRHDGRGEGYPGLFLRPDVAGTPDGLAAAPYVREGRRIRARFTVAEGMISAAANPGLDRAPEMPRSVGVGAYRIDLHPSASGRNYYDVSTLPFQIPLGALIPQRVRNLLAGGKNLGVTHVTNGCYRLHPVEWNVGESAGTVAALSAASGDEPAAYLDDPRFADLARALDEDGVERVWPTLRAL